MKKLWIAAQKLFRLSPIVNTRTVKGNGKQAIWQEGYKTVYSDHSLGSMNYLADILNKDIPLNNLLLKDEKDAAIALLKLLGTQKKITNIPVYASATALYYIDKLNLKEKEMIQSLLIPCINEKADTMDFRSIEQTLEVLHKNPEYEKSPIVEKLKLLRLAKSNNVANQVNVCSLKRNPNLFIEKAKQESKVISAKI